jgi:hypothetical protein
MINAAVAGTIDERALNKPKKSKPLNVYVMYEHESCTHPHTPHAQAPTHKHARARPHTVSMI